jgi:hypothetical protein
VDLLYSFRAKDHVSQPHTNMFLTRSIIFERIIAATIGNFSVTCVRQDSLRDNYRGSLLNPFQQIKMYVDVSWANLIKYNLKERVQAFLT